MAVVEMRWHASVDGIWLVLMLQFLGLKCSNCPTSTQYYAVNTRASISVKDLDNNMYCSFNIAPAHKLGAGYFLELKWVGLTVPGKMPTCEDSYVEVYLTGSYKSLGRICTSNLLSTWNVFTMFSYDGNAEIKYHTGNEGKKFKFHLQIKLRNRNTDFLGSGVKCYNAKMNGGSGNFFSSGWPRIGYNFSSNPCTHEIDHSGSIETKLYFMDVNLKQQFSGCDRNDVLIIKGSRSQQGYEDSSSLTSAICGDKASLIISTQYTRIYIRFLKFIRMGNYKARGFVAGYLSYEKKASPMKAVMIALVVCLFVLLALLIGICSWYRFFKRRQLRAQSAVPSDESTEEWIARRANNNSRGNSEQEGSWVTYSFTLPPYSVDDPFPRSPDNRPPTYLETTPEISQTTTTTN